MDVLRKFEEHIKLVLVFAVFVIAGILENVFCMTHGVIW